MQLDGEILEFGIKKENEERRDGGCAFIYYPETKKYATYINLKNNHLGIFGGGFNEQEDEKEGVLREVIEESGLYDFTHIEKIDKVLTHYYNSNKDINRVAYATCFLIILNSTKQKPLKLEEHENFQLSWLTDKEILSKWESINSNKDYDHWIYFLDKAVKRIKDLGFEN